MKEKFEEFIKNALLFAMAGIDVVLELFNVQTGPNWPPEKKKN